MGEYAPNMFYKRLQVFAAGSAQDKWECPSSEGLLVQGVRDGWSTCSRDSNFILIVGDKQPILNKGMSQSHMRRCLSVVGLYLIITFVNCEDLIKTINH